MSWLVAIVCGAVGVSLRLAANFYFSASGFPVATLIVNSGGSFAIGLLYGYQAPLVQAWSPAIYTGLSVGLLGALTTFSSFSLETLRLFQSGAHGLALINVLANNFLCLILCFAGYKAALGWLNP